MNARCYFKVLIEGTLFSKVGSDSLHWYRKSRILISEHVPGSIIPGDEVVRGRGAKDEAISKLGQGSAVREFR